MHIVLHSFFDTSVSYEATSCSNSTLSSFQAFLQNYCFINGTASSYWFTQNSDLLAYHTTDCTGLQAGYENLESVCWMYNPFLLYVPVMNYANYMIGIGYVTIWDTYTTGTTGMCRHLCVEFV